MNKIIQKNKINKKTKSTKKTENKNYKKQMHFKLDKPDCLITDNYLEPNSEEEIVFHKKQEEFYLADNSVFLKYDSDKDTVVRDDNETTESPTDNLDFDNVDYI